MSSSDGVEPGRKQAPDVSDISLISPLTYSQLVGISSLHKSSAYQSPKSAAGKREETAATQSQRYSYGDGEYGEPENGNSRTGTGPADETHDSSEGDNSYRGNGNSSKDRLDNDSQSHSDDSSDSSIRNKVLATIKGTLSRSAGLQAQASPSETPSTQESSSSSGEEGDVDRLSIDEPNTIYTEPISIIINYIEENCDKVESYLLGVGEHSFIEVFSFIMKSFYKTGFVSLKQLSMYRARAPEFFTKLSHFLRHMGLEYVNEMNRQNDITPLNSYSAAYIVSCAIECMSDSQRKHYIYQLRRDPSNKLRQRRGFNTKRVALYKLSQASSHGISNCVFFQHHFQEKVINLRG